MIPALKATPTYDFQAILATVTGESASPAARQNTLFATSREMYDKLSFMQQHGPMYPDHSAAFKWARNVGLVAGTAYTRAQTRAALKGWQVRSRYTLTQLGERFLNDLRAVVFQPLVAEPKPEPPCMALVPAGFWHRLDEHDIAHQLEDALHRDQVMEVYAQRYAVAL